MKYAGIGLVLLLTLATAGQQKPAAAPLGCCASHAGAIVCLTDEQMFSHVVKLEAKKITPTGHATARIAGRAVFEVTLTKDGHVLRAKALRCHPMLLSYLSGAVKNGRFKPYVENGIAHQACGRLTVTFSIDEDLQSVEAVNP